MPKDLSPLWVIRTLTQTIIEVSGAPETGASAVSDIMDAGSYTVMETLTEGKPLTTCWCLSEGTAVLMMGNMLGRLAQASTWQRSNGHAVPQQTYISTSKFLARFKLSFPQFRLSIALAARPDIG